MEQSHQLTRVMQVINNDYDFIRFTWSDLHGICRGRTVPAKIATKYLESGISVVSLVNCLGPRGEVQAPPIISEMHYGNCDLSPNLDTLHTLPWLGNGKYRIGQLLCDIKWQIDGTIQEASTRNMAVKQLHRLHKMGYKFLSSPEIEFRVKKANGDPIYTGTDMMAYDQYGEHQQHHFDMSTKLQGAGVFVQTMMPEYGSGQFEFTLEPDFGMNALDQVFIFKDGVKEMYRQLGFKADFKSKPLIGETGNGLHLNHSLWTIDGTHNAMWDAKSKNGLSPIAEHWTAGLVAHAAALTALGNPTISCYRRLHTPWAPDLKNWGIDNRMVSIRAKVGGEKHTYVENRLPTTACNYYMIVAATIAAGIDGVINKLSLPPPDNTNAEKLPSTLTEALEALEKDTVLCKELGPQAIEWFIHIKRKIDLEKLKDYDPQTKDEISILEKEFELYKLI